MGQAVSVSPAFRKSAAKAILAIFLFIALYLITVSLAVGLTIFCGYLGLQLIILKPAFVTLMLGAGIISFGILILIFLVKFIFKQHVTDRSHMMEISAEEQPDLHAYVQDIVKATGTSFPKRIYLSADVNASVFYDSSMLSMFFPVKKNLNIGMGLVNTVNQSELKAVLAHEFGHFSQRSMKVGSYVYNMNRVIYNMLYENESYDSMIRQWSGISSYLSLFVMLAVKVINGIQWALSKMYQVVNLQYMELSRAMEFHADEVAAVTAGSQPLIHSLMRLNLAEHSYSEVLRFYGSRLQDGLRPVNVYPQQFAVMQFHAMRDKLPFSDGLPLVTQEEMARFHKSRLVVKNQWASHPDTEDRVANLQRINAPCPQYESALAGNLFRNRDRIEEHFTQQLFSSVRQEESTTLSMMDAVAFQPAYEKAYYSNSFPPVYQGFYDYHNPAVPNIDELQVGQISEHPCIDTIFTPAVGELAADTHALEQDIQALRQIAAKDIRIKTFDYDGQKYKRSQAAALLDTLELKLQEDKAQLERKDKEACSFFAAKAIAQGKLDELRAKYKNLSAVDDNYEALNTAYRGIREATQFLQHTVTEEQVHGYLATLKAAEGPFRAQIRRMLHKEEYKEAISSYARKELESYSHEEQSYLNGNHFIDGNLRLLFAAIGHYEQAASDAYFYNKRNLLQFQELLSGNNPGTGQEDTLRWAADQSQV